jgi:cytochrome bd-type quinol oxidase subunit 2
VAALVAAIAVSLPSIARRRVKVLEIASIAAFGAFVILAFATNPGPDSVLERYARAFASATLALIALGSLLLIPFTEQYARESVPEQFWSSPRFKRINRVLTLTWGLIFAAIAVSHVFAGAIDTRRAQTIFNWVIPIALLVLGLKYMEAYRARETAEEGTSEPTVRTTGSLSDTASGEKRRP